MVFFAFETLKFASGCCLVAFSFRSSIIIGTSEGFKLIGFCHFCLHGFYGPQSDLFAQVIEECNSHILHLGSLIRKSEELKKTEELRKTNNQELDETEKKELRAYSSGALVHHFSLLRNKRCLMAYVYHRAEIIRNLVWTIGRVLPEEIEEKISSAEKDYFKKHAATLQSYMSELDDLDLAVDMVPPKDPYIKVRVLEDIGNVVLSDHSANLARHAIVFLRRTDAELYIAQGSMEEITS
ncbi:hypothetical protein M9H77_29311 [Catharanthus roseus]|uniref:Uncharacterized protein n=1 Tax=Catharanthus roseus TaxID=4058 RepID=A0ACC0AM62_CATRO|nr:hypothetical protein M9H77_29311 [Catharanthus roseus]